MYILTIILKAEKITFRSLQIIEPSPWKKTLYRTTFVLMAALTRSVYHLYGTRLLITHIELRDGLSSITEDASDVFDFMLYEDPNSSLFKSKDRSLILLIELNFFLVNLRILALFPFN